jgi:hypothetical protein
MGMYEFGLLSITKQRDITTRLDLCWKKKNMFLELSSAR